MLTEQSAAELQRLLDRTALAHFRFGKAALTSLNPARSASMLFVSDGAGARMHLPLGKQKGGAGRRPGSLQPPAPPRSPLTPPCVPAGKRLLSPETSLHTVASAAVYGVILAAQASVRPQHSSHDALP